MEQHNAGYGEEKHYLRPNQITVHGIPIQQSPQVRIASVLEVLLTFARNCTVYWLDQNLILLRNPVSSQ